MNRTLTGWVSFCLLASAGVALGQEPLRVETVRAAWKERDAKVRTARFAWKQTVFSAKGGQYDAFTGLDGKLIPAAPPDDHTFSSDSTLVIDGDRLVYRFTNRSWDHDKQTYYETPTEYKFDGSKQLSLDHPRSNGVQPWAQALIQVEPQGAVLPWETRPVVRTLRGTNPKVRADDLDQYAPSGALLALGGGRGRELMSKGAPTRSERHLWIDPTRAFITLRDTSGPAAHPYWQTDVKFKPDATVGWVPSEWKVVNASMVDGRIKGTWTATVTSYSINEPVDEATFAFTLPPGCSVTDETQQPSRYIHREDGSKRVIGPSDLGKTYQELVSTPGPTAAGGGWRWWTGLFLAAFVGAGVLLLVARVWLTRRAGRSSAFLSPNPTPGVPGARVGGDPV